MSPLLRARRVLEARPPTPPAVAGRGESLDDGPSAQAVRAAPDPYWPKWDGPWWRLLLKWELGAPVSRPAVEALVDLGRRTWLPVFPRTQEELDAALAASPREAFDGARHLLCFCAVGGLASLAHASGADLDAALPWWRPFVVGYQLPDGGWNCDEAAHVRAAPCSSVVSTAPVLEALLDRHASLVPAEREALDRGVRYLLARRLVRSLRKDAVIDERWFTPCFPRFYDYDALRGLSVVVRWARVTGAMLPAESVVEVLEALAARVEHGVFCAGRNEFVLGNTTIRPPAEGSGPWTTRLPAGVPTALERALQPGPNAALDRAWRTALADLAALDAEGRLV